MREDKVVALFLDIGNVLLTNGWDHTMRQRAAQKFALDYEEMNERHHLTFDTYEEGKLSLAEYLGRVVFYRSRSFSPKEFRDFIFAQSKPKPEMIQLVQELKELYGLKTQARAPREGRNFMRSRIAPKYRNSAACSANSAANTGAARLIEAK